MTLNKIKLNSFNCWGLPDRKKDLSNEYLVFIKLKLYYLIKY